MSNEKMTASAREAIRIAEKFMPTDLKRQKSLAMDILAAFELCEAELGAEIVQRLKAASTLPNGGAA